MTIKKVTDFAFAPYGRVVEGYDFEPLLELLESKTERPADRTLYQPSDEEMEALPVFAQLRDGAYGGMPIQIGYCNGYNTRLNCLEYHRGSEINVAADDVVLLVAQVMALRENTIRSDAVKAFLLPRGTAVLLYETTLHYAPCATTEEGFRVIIVLPRDTNTAKPDYAPRTGEDKLLWARNKWLVAHPDTTEAQNGAVAGILGPNIDLSKK